MLGFWRVRLCAKMCVIFLTQIKHRSCAHNQRPEDRPMYNDLCVRVYVCLFVGFDNERRRRQQSATSTTFHLVFICSFHFCLTSGSAVSFIYTRVYMFVYTFSLHIYMYRAVHMLYVGMLRLCVCVCLYVCHSLTANNTAHNSSLFATHARCVNDDYTTRVPIMYTYV